MSEEITLVVVGGGGVGKTCLTVQLTQGTFDEEYNPTIEDTYQKAIEFEGSKVMLNILDTAGQEEYAVLRDQYWRQGDGFLVVYDITNGASLAEIPKFFDLIQKAKDSKNFPTVLCGNKCDLDDSRVIKKEQGQAEAKKYNWSFFETSAKDRINVEEAFMELVKTIYKSKASSADSKEKVGANLEKKKSGGLFSIFKKKK